MLVKFSVITLFPEALQPYLASSMMAKAALRGIAQFELVNLRNFGLGPHKSVDDTPYGGGDGMLLRCEPAFAAIEAIKARSPRAKVIIPTPGGQLWTQRLAETFKQAILAAQHPSQFDKNQESLSSAQTTTIDKMPEMLLQTTDPTLDKQAENVNVGQTDPLDNTEKSDKITQDKLIDNPENNGLNQPAHYIIFCPHYEGLDARILTLADYQISLGKYILTGGELPALIIIDSIVRLLPGVLGGEQSASIESFSEGNNLEYPQYTKPYDFRGMTVPDILLSGNHGAVDQWRAENSGTFQEQ